MPEPQKPLAPHIEEAIQAIANMHRRHHRDATFLERFTDRATAAVGRPHSLMIIAVFIVAWIAAAKVGILAWLELPDPFPYPLLDLIITVAAIAIAVLILSSQRRADRLGLMREQMTLEVALLTEHKATKIIQLLEELRRDLPDVHDRHDEEARAMADKPDHETVLTIIDEVMNKDAEEDSLS